jgi:hypothetical protein
MKSLHYRPGKWGFDLSQRIGAAGRTRIFSSASVKLAHKMRLEANGTIHLAPGAAPTPLLSLAVLTLMLIDMFPEAHPSDPGA